MPARDRSKFEGFDRFEVVGEEKLFTLCDGLNGAHGPLGVVSFLRDVGEEYGLEALTAAVFEEHRGLAV